VVAVDGVGAVSVLLPGVLAVAGGGGTVPLSATLGAGGPSGCARAVSDALGVRVDGAWVVTSAGLAALVDTQGGVVVDVDQEVRSGGALVAAGNSQRLVGAQAAAFAALHLPSEPPEAELARFSAVLSGVVTALPAEAGTLSAELSGLGPDSVSTLAPSALVDFLLALRGHASEAGLAGTVLATRPAAAGDTGTVTPDGAALARLVAGQLAGAALPGRSVGSVRVLVRNGVGSPGLGDAARRRLLAAGLRFLEGGNARTFGSRATSVVVPGAGVRDRALGERVAAALRVPASAVSVGSLSTETRPDPTPTGSLPTATAQEVPDVVVVLGQDFADDVSRNGVVVSPTGSG
jgi:hypothetical protein